MKPAELLNSLGLGEYVAAFEENAIDERSLRSLTDSDLKELGVAKLGHRKKILEALAAPQRSGSSAGALDELIAGLPNVVALPLREYAGEEHPVAKLWAMCDTIELLLRLVVVAFVSHQRERGGLSEKTAESLAGLVESPTLGAWFVMAQTLAKETDPTLKDAAGFVEGPLRDLLYGPEKPGTAETSLLRLRNRLAHGGGLTCREATRLLQLWQLKFEKTIVAMQWLAGWKLAGRDKQGRWLSLAGPEPGEADFAPHSPTENVDAVWIKIGDASFPLWPLAVFGQAKAPGATKQGSEDLTQIYTRRENLRLAYTPVGAEGLAQSESGPTGFEAFKSLFQLDRPKRTDFTVADFAAELRKDAAQAVGRDMETATIVEAVHRHDQGVLWISGAAGTGKSFLVAKALAEILDRGPGEQTLVLAYRFLASDQARCSREALATFLEERLKAAGAIAPSEEQDRGEDAAKRIDNCLARLKAGWNVVVFLDGLDEVTRRDQKFGEEIPLGLRLPNVLWVCSGRPESDLSGKMLSLGALSLFPDGLPPMSCEDIRAMVLEKIGPLRRKLLAGDEEKGDAVVNPFINLVTQRAAGLPLYVKYVIGDVLLGKYRVLDGQEDLPDSLHAYHEELLRRLAVGDLQAVVTPLVATLACAHEPLSAAELQTVLLHRKLLAADGANDLVDRALAATASMLATGPDPEGETGFVIFHQSLRDHMHSSPEMKQSIAIAREALAELAVLSEPPVCLAGYLARCGVRHLIDSGRDDQARGLLLDFDQLARMEAAGVGWPELYRLWAQVGGEKQAASYSDSFAAALSHDGKDRSKLLQQGRNLLLLHYESMWFASGEKLGRVVCDAHVDALGSAAPETFEVTTMLAGLLALKSDNAEAERLLRSTLLAAKEVHGAMHAAYSHAANELGQLLLKTGALEEAELLLRQAIDQRQASLGPDDPATLESVNHLATLLMKAKDDLDGARLLYERVLQGRTKLLGPRNLYTLESVNNLANIHLRSREFDKAEELYSRSLEGNMALLGPSHPATLIIAANLANALRARGDNEAAEKLLALCLRRASEVLGKTHPTTLSFVDALARTKQAKGDLQEAHRLFERAVAGNENLYGFEHRETLRSAIGLAEVLYHMRDFHEAEQVFRRTLDAAANHLGENNRATLHATFSLACVLHSKWELEEAATLLRSLLNSPGMRSDEADRLMVMAELAEVLEKDFNFEESEKLLWQVFDGRCQTLGPAHSLTGESLQKLAGRLRSKGDQAGAESLLYRAQKIHIT